MAAPRNMKRQMRRRLTLLVMYGQPADELAALIDKHRAFTSEDKAEMHAWLHAHVSEVRQLEVELGLRAPRKDNDRPWEGTA